ncbi:MAG TPA: CapA family protein, partial [Polyangiaceae bacterium]|nr:CapA family protein [Polyangiaceae bacterium]
MRASIRLLRPTLAAWGLAFLARHLVGCSTEAPPADTNAESATEAVVATAAESATPSRDGAAVEPAAFQRASALDKKIVTLSAVGDCTLGAAAGTERAPGSFHRVFDDNGGDLARPFSLVRAELDKDDLTIANLETTLTTADCRTDLPFAFRGRPEFAKMLPLGSVDIVTLANNHTNDCGRHGLAETKASLEAAGVGWFGLGKADRRTIHGIEVVNLGYTGGRLEIEPDVTRDV